LYKGLDAVNVVVTAGALEAIRAVAMALVEPGQRIFVQEQSYGALRQAVVDEVYRPIALVPGTAPASCIDASPRAVSIGDLSKPLGLGGLRIGWIASHDREVIERCADAVDYLSGSVSTLSAAVALHALQRFDELLASHLQ